MTTSSAPQSRVSTIVTAVLIAALAVSGLVYRTTLIAWFRGDDMNPSRVSGAAPSPGASSPGAPHDHAQHQAVGDEIDHYTCSMHPSVHQPGPGTCPICGMKLIPVTKRQQAEGLVLIDEGRRQLIGVRTAPVVAGPMERTFRALGRVAYDESSFVDVNLKVSGWITKLVVNQTGQRVTRGQTLFMLYSPDLYSAQQDFFLASRGASTGTLPTDVPNRLQQLGLAARKRLSLLGLNEAQINKIAAGSEPLDTIPITSPASGYVIEKNVVEGASVEASTRLFRIAALDKVWVEADVYEEDLSRVHAGQSAQVTLDYLPDHAYAGTVAYVYPDLTPETRTGKIRVELKNAALLLRPGMYARVELSSSLGDRLQVPTSAVVYTGPRRLVFVDVGEGRFKPQEVRVGTESNGLFEVLDGLKAGDMVATSGVFLIAAEARISTAATYWDKASAPSGPDLPPSNPPRMDPNMEMPDKAEHPTNHARLTEKHTPPPSKAAVYSCPMHPEVRSAVPGKCPKCGMDLVRVQDGKAPSP